MTSLIVRRFTRELSRPAMFTSIRLCSSTRPPAEEKPPTPSESRRHFRHSMAVHPLKEKIQLPGHKLEKGDGQYTLAHPIWNEEELNNVEITHKKPEDRTEKLAYYTVQLLRFGFDIFSGYTFGSMNEIKWLRRIIFLETVAGVPGMMGAMVRHLSSLRTLKRDFGWIHTLLEEAENERMHLLTALALRQPGKLFRWAVVITQGIFTNFFFLAYLISPRYCHRFVGYLEEEAVKTYSRCLDELDKGKLKMWAQMPAPEIAVNYWQLKDGAMMRDVILALRADEAHHCVVNHTFGSMKEDEANPYKPGE